MSLNFYTMSTEQLRERMNSLNHAGAIEEIINTHGQVVGRKKYHYLTCTRCVIEKILESRNGK